MSLDRRGNPFKNPLMIDHTYCLVTFGCQMNEADSEYIAGILEALGWTALASEEDAELVLFNTCVVRQGAEDRALARVDRLKTLKKTQPRKKLAICGCLAQQDGQALLEQMPYLDLVMGTRAIPRLASLIEALDATGEPQVCADLEGDPYDIAFGPKRGAGLAGRINIIAGCNKNCSYCIVPSTRGRELSRPAATIAAEAAQLAAAGRKEILLIGQNVNSYRDGQTDLAGLLAEINAVDGVERIRFVTSHPRDANEAMFRAMADLPKVCESLHLPVQSGSSAQLRQMYRGYSRERYLAKIERLRQLMPSIGLSTDVIVGFCGETDADFEQTLSLMREVRFDSAFMFMYSPRRGTAAAREMADDVPLAVKKERLARLIALQESIAAEKNRALVGQTCEVLAERPARKTPGAMSGRTREDKTVVFAADETLAGRLVRVRITGSNAHTLMGRRFESSLAKPSEPKITCAN